MVETLRIYNSQYTTFSEGIKNLYKYLNISQCNLINSVNKRIEIKGF